MNSTHGFASVLKKRGKWRWVQQLAAAAAVAVPCATHAVVSDLGNLDNTFAGFGNFFAVATADFSDSFTFNVTGDSNISGLTGSSGIATLGLVLLDSSAQTIATDLTPSSFSFDVDAGTYTLNFVGFGAGPASFYGGVVTGTLTDDPQGVPEPATLALLGLAFAGLGFSRRRKLS